MELRTYQKRLIFQILDAWQRKKRRVIAVAPTGSGKTVIFAKLLEEYLRHHPEQVLIVAHREELILQARSKIENVTELPIGIIKYGYKPDLTSPIQIASIQTLASNLDLEIEPKLIVIDEVHHAVADSYRNLLRQFPTSFVLGVTATPIRTDGQGFDDLFDELITGPSVAELIQQGYLAPFKVFGAKQIQIKDTKITNGDYSRSSLVNEIDRSLVYGDLVSAYQQYAPNSKTVVFCVDIEHSLAAAAAYRAAGIAAEHIDGEVDYTERRAILDRFRSGETQVLTNCELILEGFDLDDIQTVQVVRPTTSLALYLQMIGRVLRPHADKPYATIIDHTSNVALFGLPDHPHHWSLKPTPAPLSAWVQKCPRCDHIFRCLKSEQKITRQTRTGVPRQYGIAICPCCQTRFEFVIRKAGLIFNADIPQRIVTEIENTAIVELDNHNKPVLKAGNPQVTERLIIDKALKGIHPDLLKIINNAMSDGRDAREIIATLVKMEIVEDFGINHWQYIGAKLGYRPSWSKGAFYKYTIRSRMKIRSDRPEESLSKIYAICAEEPTMTSFVPDNWTIELESAEKYIDFARSHRQKYYLVPMMRNERGEWMVEKT
jgi:superfamily II DNA or RNA helicase